MMGATAIAVNTMAENIAAHASQAASFHIVEQNYLYAPHGIRSGAGSSNDFLMAPLFSGDSGPKTPPDSGGISVSTITTPVQKDEPMLKLALRRRTGKSSKTTEPLGIPGPKTRLNKNPPPTAIF